MKKYKKPSKEVVCRLRELVVSYVLQHGGAWTNPEIEALGLVLPTRLGVLHVTLVDDWIACQWEDVERARAYFHVGKYDVQGRLNPFSGKWNFGCGARALPEEVFDAWRREVEPLLVT